MSHIDSTDKPSPSPQVRRRKRNGGFAAMPSEKVRQIASMGGKAAHALGTAHKFTSAEAQAAGRRGGSNRRGFKERRKEREQALTVEQQG